MSVYFLMLGSLAFTAVETSAACGRELAIVISVCKILTQGFSRPPDKELDVLVFSGFDEILPLDVLSSVGSSLWVVFLKFLEVKVVPVPGIRNLRRNSNIRRRSK